ncbi:transmembrane protein, putative [Bodo saltans]|uniref:Transmembrane protein, putative n=1 Tax=Bodo saltans TaxID=75058 RepID=A0A0S4IQV0_BODSA|nr:transmembrane protein, putative [Bodo saltans]|eukprot:CUF34422.1 transmembrane protein, putative [Bodo saltans]
MRQENVLLFSLPHLNLFVPQCYEQFMLFRVCAPLHLPLPLSHHTPSICPPFLTIRISCPPCCGVISCSSACSLHVKFWCIKHSVCFFLFLCVFVYFYMRNVAANNRSC